MSGFMCQREAPIPNLCYSRTHTLRFTHAYLCDKYAIGPNGSTTVTPKYWQKYISGGKHTVSNKTVCVLYK